MCVTILLLRVHLHVHLLTHIHIHTHIITKVQIRRIGFGFERKGCRGLSSWEAWLGEEIDDIGAICRVYRLGPGTGIETERETPVAIGVKVLLVAWYLLGIVESRCADRV